MSRLRRVLKLRDLKLGPSGLDPQQSILLVDSRVARLPAVRTWLQAFPFRRVLRTGEDLKSIESFQREVEFWQQRWGQQIHRQFCVIAIGGGSLGDFAGFIASVYWRGLRLVHVPSTWLAALDSAHGGKTALNVSGAKNQIGTFYPAEQVILVREILDSQPAARAEEARGELIKMALVDGRSWSRAVRSALKNCRTENGFWQRLIWRSLPQVVDAKLRIVRRDPRELNGQRQILNLGHTWGHVLEAELGWPHGRCVELGLHFIDEFFTSDFCAESDRLRQRVLPALSEAEKRRARVTRVQARTRLARDKKRADAGHVTVIQALAWGKVRRVRVELQALLDFAQAEGWLR